MDDNRKTRLLDMLGKSADFDVSMSSYSTFRAGGKAEAVCRVSKPGILKELVHYLDSGAVPRMAVGKGSNLLVTDGGIKGVVIILEGELADIREEKDGLLTAGAGLSIAGLLKYCLKKELSGMEFLAGIPGTLGGAVAMNAGACGDETGNLVAGVGIVGPGGITEEIDRSQISFGYRKTSLPEKSIIYSVTLRLERGKRETIKEKIEHNLERRKKSQPLDMPSCGSVFRNPEGDYAGRLIEQCGLKGKSIGGAMVSSKHANFIVNRGNATASEILDLMDLVKSKVRDETGITLEPEIRIAGE